jgi:hypothetical protein
MLYVYCFCNGSATVADEEYHRQFPTCRILDHSVFSKVFNKSCEHDPSAHVSPEQACKQHVEEQENILEMVQQSPTTRT